ncbi:MAG TPA: DsbA family protein [Myxococcota bacterium]|nr:DsbA family protein [Myxococcota bacterium]
MRVRTYYDFASTLCYVAHRVFGEMQAELDSLGVELEWVPVDLADLAGWPRRAEVAPARLANAERVAAEHGIEVAPLRVWPDSRDANAAALLLRSTPQERAFRARVFAAVFEERRALDAPGAVDAFAIDVGVVLDPRRLERARDELEFRTQLAREEDVTGVPTLMLDEFPFGGIQSRETTRLVLERWIARKLGAARPHD